MSQCGQTSDASKLRDPSLRMVFKAINPVIAAGTPGYVNFNFTLGTLPNLLPFSRCSTLQPSTLPSVNPLQPFAVSTCQVLAKCLGQILASQGQGLTSL